MSRVLTVRGKVSQGFGEGRKYVTKDPYREYFIKELGAEPYPGTLNLLTEYRYDEIASICPPSRIEFGQGSGALLVWRGGISNMNGYADKVLILRPLLSRHPPNVIEAVSPANLREKLGLTNGSTVTLRLECGDPN